MPNTDDAQLTPEDQSFIEMMGRNLMTDTPPEAVSFLLYMPAHDNNAKGVHPVICIENAMSKKDALRAELAASLRMWAARLDDGTRPDLTETSTAESIKKDLEELTPEERAQLHEILESMDARMGGTSARARIRRVREDYSRLNQEDRRTLVLQLARDEHSGEVGVNGDPKEKCTCILPARMVAGEIKCLRHGT